MTKEKVIAKIVNGKIAYVYETSAQTKKYSHKKPTSQNTKKLPRVQNPGKLEKKVKTVLNKAKGAKQTYDNPPQVEADSDYVEPQENAEYSKPDETDYLSMDTYKTALSRYDLVTNDEKNTVLRKYGGNLAMAVKDIEDLNEERMSERRIELTTKTEEIESETPVPKLDKNAQSYDGNTSDNESNNDNGNGHGTLEGKTIASYHPWNSRKHIKKSEKTGRIKTYHSIFETKKDKTNQRGIPKTDTNSIPYPELPQVEGVIEPEDPRYEERFRILHSIGNRSAITTKKTAGGKNKKVVPGLPEEYQGKSTFNLQDIRKAPPPKLEKIVHQITHDEKYFNINHAHEQTTESVESNWSESAQKVAEEDTKLHLVTIEDV